MNLPNGISFGRFVSVPLIIWLIITERFDLAFILFSIAALSDAVDGFVAKRFGMETALGGFIDPIADKSLLVGVFVTLGAIGALPVWLVILVVFRDLSIMGGWLMLIMFDGPRRIRPTMISKINTTVQLVLVIVVLAQSAFATLLSQWPLDPLIYATAATTIISGIGYGYWLIQAWGDLERLP